MNQMNTPKTLLETLVAIRELLTPPERWTKGAYGRRHLNESLSWKETQSDATCFCLMGACAKVTMDHSDSEISNGVRRIMERMVKNASDFNDAETTTHADILAKLDEAIAIAREECL